MTIQASDAAVATGISPGKQQWCMTTNRFSHLGIYRGDTLQVETEQWQQNGAWLIVAFNNRYHIRELQLLPGHWRLEPLCGKLQAIDWPMHIPLPVVGRITGMQRCY